MQSQLNDLLAEEAEARKEAIRDEMIKDIESQTEELNDQLDAVNNSLNTIIAAIVAASKEGADVSYRFTDDGGFVLTINGEDFKPYAEGGLVDYTGPAMVHGTPSNPEAFLDAGDTKNMRALLNAIDFMMNSPINTQAQTESINTDNSVVIENINIQTNELNNQQDFRQSGQIFAEEFAKAIRQRGININVKK